MWQAMPMTKPSIDHDKKMGENNQQQSSCRRSTCTTSLSHTKRDTSSIHLSSPSRFIHAVLPEKIKTSASISRRRESPGDLRMAAGRPIRTQRPAVILLMRQWMLSIDPFTTPLQTPVEQNIFACTHNADGSMAYIGDTEALSVAFNSDE